MAQHISMSRNQKTDKPVDITDKWKPKNLNYRQTKKDLGEPPFPSKVGQGSGYSLQVRPRTIQPHYGLFTTIPLAGDKKIM